MLDIMPEDGRLPPLGWINRAGADVVLLPAPFDQEPKIEFCFTAG